MYLKKGYFFEASQVQGHEHANVSKVLPHLLQGLTKAPDGTDVLMDLAIAWRFHQMLLAGNESLNPYMYNRRTFTAFLGPK